MQPFKGVLRKRCSKNIQEIYWRTPMPKDISIKLLCYLFATRIYLHLYYVVFEYHSLSLSFPPLKTRGVSRENYNLKYI